MSTPIFVLGEALMDCIAQPDGQLRPCMGGSPYNLARAVARQGAAVAYLNPLSSDLFGQVLQSQLLHDGVCVLASASRRPTSLAVVQLRSGQPDYGFYREGIADRDYTVDSMLSLLRSGAPGILHTGSLALVPPEHEKVLAIVRAAKEMGWVISVDVNIRPRLSDDLPAYLNAVRSVMVLADWLKASDEDLFHLGMSAQTLSAAPQVAQQLRVQLPLAGFTRLALTYGAKGAYLEVGGAYDVAPAPAVEVADTVGAGDTFWGTTLADWVLGTGDAAQRVGHTLRRAMQAAAINCQRHGCHPPTREEMQTAPA